MPNYQRLTEWACENRADFLHILQCEAEEEAAEEAAWWEQYAPTAREEIAGCYQQGW